VDGDSAMFPIRLVDEPTSLKKRSAFRRDAVSRHLGLGTLLTISLGLSQRAWLILGVIVGLLLFSKMLLCELPTCDCNHSR
jgi:hypothetical protein